MLAGSRADLFASRRVDRVLMARPSPRWSSVRRRSASQRNGRLVRWRSCCSRSCTTSRTRRALSTRRSCTPTSACRRSTTTRTPSATGSYSSRSSPLRSARASPLVASSRASLARAVAIGPRATLRHAVLHHATPRHTALRRVSDAPTHCTLGTCGNVCVRLRRRQG